MSRGELAAELTRTRSLAAAALMLTAAAQPASLAAAVAAFAQTLAAALAARSIVRAHIIDRWSATLYTFWVGAGISEFPFHVLATVLAALGYFASQVAASPPSQQLLAALPAVVLLPSIPSLLILCRQQLQARGVFQQALKVAGVPAAVAARSVSAAKAVIAACPWPPLLMRNIEVRRGIAYGRVHNTLDFHIDVDTSFVERFAPTYSPLRRQFLAINGKVAAAAAKPAKPHDLHLDLYWHARRRLSPAPVVLYVHGGAWVAGNRAISSMPLIFECARGGCLVAAMSYRLASVAPFPAMLHDVKLAIAWLRKNAHLYGGDPACIVVAGESAGGHLSLMAGLTANVPAYQTGMNGAGVRVSAASPATPATGAAATAGPSPAAPPLVPPAPLTEADLETADTSVQGIVNLYGVTDWTDSQRQYETRDVRKLGIRGIVGGLVLRKHHSQHMADFVRGSPLWWLHGSALPGALKAAGISVDTTGKHGDATPAAEGEASPALLTTDPVQSRDPAVTGVQPRDQVDGAAPANGAGAPASSGALADMCTDRWVPPIFVVHGTNDTLVPHIDAELLWRALGERRARDLVAGRGNAAASDVFVSVPGAHHAFNFVPSLRTFALGDAIRDWVTQIHTSQTSRRASSGGR